MEGKDEWITRDEGMGLAARTFLPTTPGPHPVIILATGLGTVKENRTSSFVTEFVNAGYACITFDYSTYGGSEGSPRHTVKPNDQYHDLCTVVAWARKQDKLYDSVRIVVWGSSFGGLHVTRLLAEDHTIAAGISQCPCVDASAASRMKPLMITLNLGFWAILDVLGSLIGRPPIYVAAAADMPGDNYKGPALMKAPDVPKGYSLVVDSSKGPLKNRLTARSVLYFPLARPNRKASNIVAPYLVVVPEYDTVAPREAAIEVSKKAKYGELFITKGGHFDLYDGMEGYQKNIERQLEFLRKVVPASKN
jgi:alpha/beta superfamily hydrolase